MTGVPVDAVYAFGAMSTRIAVALVHVDFAVGTGSSRLTATYVTSDQVFTVSAKLTRVRFAFVDLDLTQIPGVPRVALAGERIVPIDADSPVARVRSAVVDVRLAGHSRISGWALARVPGDGIMADTAVPAGLR